MAERTGLRLKDKMDVDAGIVNLCLLFCFNQKLHYRDKVFDRWSLLRSTIPEIVMRAHEKVFFPPGQSKPSATSAGAGANDTEGSQQQQNSKNT
eukprot:8432192-Karenia_brevis.AAC.1